MKFASYHLITNEISLVWFKQALVQPWFWASIISDFFGFFCWMTVLKDTKLSIAFPISSICFITVLLSGIFIFEEKTNLYHWIGTAVLMFGIYLLTFETKSSKRK